MEAIWFVLGVVVLTATLLDVFLTALNYDEAGFISGVVTRVQWRVLRQITRRLPRRWRAVGLRQVTGIQIVVVIAVWLFGIILGFGLVYYGLMSKSSFSVSGSGAGLTLFDALYFSAAQLSTVGGSSLTAETDLLRFLSITETLTGVILISLVLTFLLGVYSVISDLNTLCRYFFTVERGAGSPVASLSPFFRDGQPNGLDGHLDGIVGAFAAYTDGLRFHHAAYYFQSGHDQFALPYALRMLAGTLGALRWGLPSGHPASTDPGLVPLTFQFLEFGEYIKRGAPWKSRDVPEVVSAEEFTTLVRDHGRDAGDGWVGQFVDLDASMARLAQVEPLADIDDAYQRYSQWLPFAYRAQQIALAVSKDLDYQPAIVTDRPISLLHSHDTLAMQTVLAEESSPVRPQPDPARELPAPAGSRLSRWWSSLDLRHSQVDPGYARLRAASRAVLAAVSAALLLYLFLDATGRTALQPAIFCGFVGMLSTGASGGTTPRAARITSALVVLPIGVVVLLGALVSDSVLLTGVLVVVVALLGVWSGRFGPRWASLGRVTFMSYYFALILRLDISEVLPYLCAAVVGVAMAFLFNHVLLPPRPRRILRSGIDGFGHRLLSSLDPLLDAVAGARWDPDIRRRVSLSERQLRRDAAFLEGQLSADESMTDIPAERAAALRLRVFDSELALTNLVMAARNVTGTVISLELRGRLAGRIELLQAHLVQMARQPGIPGAEAPARDVTPLAPWSDDDPPPTWPKAARLLYQAIGDLHRSAREFRTVAVATLDPTVPFTAALSDDVGVDSEPDRSVATPTPDAAAGGRPLSPTTRLATQAAVATGAALTIGEIVSATHQYWAALAAYQVLGGTNGETFVKGAQRVAGTVAGAAVGFWVVLSTDADAAVVLPLLAVAVFGSTYYRPVAPAVSTFWTTMIFALLYEFLGRLTTLALEIRVLETLFGAAIALVVSVVVLPTRTRSVVNKDIASLAKDVDAIVSASLSRLAGDRTISRSAIRQRLFLAEQHVRTIDTAAAPLRLAPSAFAVGAFEVGGVESRLTAVWSLMYHTRHLVGAVEHAISAGVSTTAEDWRDLGGATSENVTALTTALSGSLPGRVNPVVTGDDGQEEDGLTPAASRATKDVLRELQLVNQTVLALTEDISPGAVNAADKGDAVRL
ncbi:FUSC family protein [Mumia sp. ZJ430]|uniref:FUSC family protein n=1 Tax=Mumia sp. ZJ430 TaxID=2708083 RepID=UPI00141D9DBE|nr:FUSC family protein [Mumia sp. ZJ430]